MFKRYSIVNKLDGITLSFSSLYQLGDSENINALSFAYAVQREKEFFLTSEGSFDSDVFQGPLKTPPIDPTVRVNRLNLCPIKVDQIFVKATAFSSIIHIGNTSNVAMEARVKHIRQLEPKKHEETENFETIDQPD
ncbi:spore germination protein GerPE [Rossellomorea vietnamensis]|uniref:Spore germination protein GerPE n=1 Tax=Rossellomorea vietnamensis TaxID=218284 RepID=A0A6I6UP03_9BACI|nr:spore germination protein GerPE [Rossellomorea vietnamensis]QHE60951.1 spore germination protein GerPE [Rossellomorea vietnamensis]